MTINLDTFRGPDMVNAELEILRAYVRGEDTQGISHQAAMLRATRTGNTGLDRIQEACQLSDFERTLLLLAAGPELSPGLAADLAEHTGSRTVSFQQAVQILPDASWASCAPCGALRKCGLLHVADVGHPLRSPLRVDERVLFELVNVSSSDHLLTTLAAHVVVPTALPDTLDHVAHQIVRAWEADQQVVAYGAQLANVRDACATAAYRGGYVPWAISVSDIAGNADRRQDIITRMERETALAEAMWIVRLATQDGGITADHEAVVREIHAAGFPAVVVSEQPPLSDRLFASHQLARIEVPRVPVDERSALLREHLCAQQVAPDVLAKSDVAAKVFDIPAREVQAVAQRVSSGESLWQACKQQLTIDVRGRAKICQPQHTWASCNVPQAQQRQLSDFVDGVLGRKTPPPVAAGSQVACTGTAVVFSSQDSTNSSTAAEAVASAMGFEMLTADVTWLETASLQDAATALSRLFDVADNGGVVLMFSGADNLLAPNSTVHREISAKLADFRGTAIFTVSPEAKIASAVDRHVTLTVDF